MLTTRRRHRGVIAALSCTTFVAIGTAIGPGAGVGAATSDPPGPTGDLIGYIGLSGGWRSTMNGSVGIDVRYDIVGPMTMRLDDGEMSGDWSMEGSSSVTGELISGSGSHVGTGTFAGRTGEYRMVGSIESSSSITMQSVGREVTVDSPPDRYAFDEPLTEVLVTCDQVSGRWDARLIAGTAAVGESSRADVTPTFSGVFFAIGDVDGAPEVLADLVALVDDWVAGAAEETDVDARLDRALEALLVLSIMRDQLADLPTGSGCDPECAFTTPLARPATDVVRILIAAAPGSITSAEIALLLDSGALSSCHDGADLLREELQRDLDARFVELLDRIDRGETDISDPATVATASDIARAAIALGSTSLGPNGIAPGDVLVVLGVAS